jgi:hypothetical protein
LRASLGGVRLSSAPTMIVVGTSIVPSSGVESGRAAMARSAAAIPVRWLASIIRHAPTLYDSRRVIR